MSLSFLTDIRRRFVQSGNMDFAELALLNFICGKVN